MCVYRSSHWMCFFSFPRLHLRDDSCEQSESGVPETQNILSLEDVWLSNSVVVKMSLAGMRTNVPVHIQRSSICVTVEPVLIMPQSTQIYCVLAVSCNESILKRIQKSISQFWFLHFAIFCLWIHIYSPSVWACNRSYIYGYPLDAHAAQAQHNEKPPNAKRKHVCPSSETSPVDQQQQQSNIFYYTSTSTGLGLHHTIPRAACVRCSFIYLSKWKPTCVITQIVI